MDIISWTFGRPRAAREEPVYIDANDPKRSLSSNGVRTLVRQLVAGLGHYGLVKGDPVCTVSFNDINYTAIYLGIIGAGGCFTGANPGYTTRELAHQVKITGAKFILTELKTLDISAAAATECGIPDSNIFVLNFRDEDVPAPYRSWNALLEYGERDWVEIDDPATPAAYISTSGTTGLTKAATIPHSYLISQGAVIEKLLDSKKKVSYLVAIPPFHAFTIPVQHALPLRNNISVYTLPRFEENSFLNALRNFKIARTIAVPPILLALSKHPAAKLESLRQICVGGSPLPLGVQEELYAKLSPAARITQVYGMTEVGWATHWKKKKRDMSGSIGQALPGFKIRVVDREGKVLLKQGAIGEIQIYNQDSMKGYLNNINATREAFTPDCWVRTGDVGYVKDKNWYVVDRAKDLIKVRGWQVSPAEIEAALLEHPDIRDAGVIGIPAPDGCGESPMAFIVLNEGKSLDENQVKVFLATRLARYKNVEEVNFVEQIPRNPVGKILRRVLRDMRETGQPTPDQAAAKEYATALQKISVYEKLQVSGSEKTVSLPNLVAGESKPVGSEQEVTTDGTGSKKRKLYPASHVWQWRKRRILTRSQKIQGSSIRVDGREEL